MDSYASKEHRTHKLLSALKLGSNYQSFFEGITARRILPTSGYLKGS